LDKGIAVVLLLALVVAAAVAALLTALALLVDVASPPRRTPNAAPTNRRFFDADNISSISLCRFGKL
jgi:hypothetical protein